MVVHSTVLCYTRPDLLIVRLPIPVHASQSNVDYLRPSLRSTNRFESLSMNHCNHKNFAERAKNYNIKTIKLNSSTKSDGRKKIGY